LVAAGVLLLIHKPTTLSTACPKTPNQWRREGVCRSGQNVCVAVPANQIISAIKGVFSGFRTRVR